MAERREAEEGALRSKGNGAFRERVSRPIVSSEGPRVQRPPVGRLCKIPPARPPIGGVSRSSCVRSSSLVREAKQALRKKSRRPPQTRRAPRGDLVGCPDAEGLQIDETSQVIDVAADPVAAANVENFQPREKREVGGRPDQLPAPADAQ